MVKQKKSCILASVFLLLVFLVSCQNPIHRNVLADGDWGQITIRLADDSARTLLPEQNLQIASYDLVFSASGQQSIERTMVPGASGSFSLPVGAWNLQVTGKNANNFPLVSGSSSFNVQQGQQTSVAVVLQPIQGNGTLDLTVSLDPFVAGLSLQAHLAPNPAGAHIALQMVSTGTGFALVRDTIPQGYYTLSMNLTQGQTVLATGMESVLVAANGTTRGEINFSRDANGHWLMGSIIRIPGPGPGPSVYNGIRVFTKNFSHIHFWNLVPALPQSVWPGVALQDHSTGWKFFEFPNANSVNLIFNNNGGGQTANLTRNRGESGNWWYLNGTWYNYNPETPDAPVITSSPVPGRFNSAQTVTLLGSNPDDTIYYTLNGSTPSRASSVFTAPIVLNGKTTIRAFGVNRDGVSGEVVSLFFDIDPNYDLTLPTIRASNPGGSSINPIDVTFTIADNSGGTTRAWFTNENRHATTADTPYVQGTATGAGITGPSVRITQRTRYNFLVIDAAGNETRQSFFYNIGTPQRGDFREETIYFLLTTRFYDGDSSNNFFQWDAARAGNTQPEWRGDFKGLVQKLDYIKALGFSAVWITPVVKNMSGYDYHGYHAVNHSVVDPRLESPGYDYQRLIDEFHARGMKIIQDVVWNHTGNFGDEVLHPLFELDERGGYRNWLEPNRHVANALLEQGARAIGGPNATYASLTPPEQFQARIRALRAPLDTRVIYHNHNFKGGWEQYEVQIGSIAGDCQDLNTSNPIVTDYLINAYNRYIDMGVDAFRIDTVKHLSRLVLNREFLPAFRARGGENFFMFGEVATRFRNVWNHDNPNISTPFYTWKGANDMNYPWATREQREASVRQYWDDHLTSKPTSNNHSLLNNTYRQPDYSRFSGQAVIDFPMHWAFNSVREAWDMALSGDHYYNDATWNVTYVDSHDYAPDQAPENQRFTGFWPDKLSLIFTFRGIPTIYYGSEIEFMKGAVIDVGPNMPLDRTGRAYFGAHITGSVNVTDFGRYTNATGAMATTLAHPLATHIRALNLIRRAVPALQKGQYAVDGFQAFRRRYTDQYVDSFALVVLDGTRTFSGIPNGTYRCVVTGQSHTVNNGSATLSANGAGNLRVWVLYGGPRQADPGHVLAGVSPLNWIR